MSGMYVHEVRQKLVQVVLLMHRVQIKDSSRDASLQASPLSKEGEICVHKAVTCPGDSCDNDQALLRAVHTCVRFTLWRGCLCKSPHSRCAGFEV